MKSSDLRIAFYVYPTAFQNPGGGEVQLLKTKEYLEKKGVHVKLLDIWKDKLADFHVLHTFGSVKDALPMMVEAKRAGIKNVLSTICWYNWQSAWEIYPDLKNRFLSVTRHAVKVALPFLPSPRKKMIQIADALLPNSQSEALQLSRFFCADPAKIKVVPNAVDGGFETASPEPFLRKYGLKDFALIVGRIEPRKNQLNLVRALKGTGIPVVIIGDHVSQYKNYYDACRQSADSNFHFLGRLPHDSELLRSAYAACNTFVLPTWLETPGLAALEAGLAGAKIVITREGATREYFGSYASYVNPQSLSDIREKTKEMFAKPKNPALQQHILKNYTWDQTADKTLAAYHGVLAGS